MGPLVFGGARLSVLCAVVVVVESVRFMCRASRDVFGESSREMRCSYSLRPL